MTTDAIEAFWVEFAGATGVDATYDAFAFGAEDSDDPIEIALANELAELVLKGPKRATTSLLAEYEEDSEPLPKAGEYSVILDGSGEPACIIRTTQVDLARFGDVDGEFAWTEGEGDRSLEYWRCGHLDFFARMGLALTDDSMMVLVRFEKVWPRGGE